MPASLALPVLPLAFGNILSSPKRHTDVGTVEEAQQIY